MQMEDRLMDLPQDQATSSESYSTGHKRIKLSSDGRNDHGKALTTMGDETKEKKPKRSSMVVDYSDPFIMATMTGGLDSGKYGSVTKDIEALISRKLKVLNPYVSMQPQLKKVFLDTKGIASEDASITGHTIIDLEDDNVANDATAAEMPVIVLDSDDEGNGHHEPSFCFPLQDVVLPGHVGQFPMETVVDHAARKTWAEHLNGKTDVKKEKDVFVGIDEGDDIQNETKDDGLGDIWNEMSLALEISKDVAEFPPPDEHMQMDEDECEHSFLMKDDIGHVCRICGVIERGIETVIEVQFNKAKRSTQTYMYESRNAKSKDSNEIVGVELPEDLKVTDISAHPRHMKQMKPHQVEGFNFLRSNLVADNPRGCIMAHAPGSGKTFMLMQSFLAKYPDARPLVALPKGILATWKKEFKTWQVEDIPLYDFYSLKAESRIQQLEVLKQWVQKKSVLFLGYKQVSAIVCDKGNSNTVASCQEILLKRPSILILDEGHTPRNEDTDVLQSLAQVQTPRKVVLLGTLYQNHVKEVFNVLNLVLPKFLRLDTSRAIVKRIMSKVHIPGVRKHLQANADEAFYELVEHTIQRGQDFRRKVAVIQDLREMTSKVLHYYKGDFLDELPGLVDFTVVLNLSFRQKQKAEKLKKLVKSFKRNYVGSAVYLHPKLTSFSENSVVTDDMMDGLLEELDVKDGAKAKFFLSMLRLCESVGEKILVFSISLP